MTTVGASTFQNRREFFRIKFNEPVKYRSYQSDSKGRVAETSSKAAGTENISQSGILFQTKTQPPAVSSIVWMNLDIRTLKICHEIENRALIFNNGLLGRVVRVEEDDTKGSSYDVGVCFLTQDEKSSKEVQAILTELAKQSDK